MGKQYSEINDQLREWIEEQKVFFVATAPLSADGHINCSPKGLDSFHILSPHEAVYQDLTGSGIETVAHLKENGRIVVMFCGFEGPPKIVRLHGIGSVIEPAHPLYDEIASRFPGRLGIRAYIKIDITRISDSCGYSIPVYEFKKERDVLDKYVSRMTDEELLAYRAAKNKASIDGMQGLD